MPYPGPVGIGMIVLFGFGYVAILLGFFTRINAIILFVLTGFVLFAPLELSVQLTPQSLVLYLTVLLALIFGGAGYFSLDYLLVGRRVRKKSRI